MRIERELERNIEEKSGRDRQFVPDWSNPGGSSNGNQKPDTGDASSRFPGVPGENERELERNIEEKSGRGTEKEVKRESEVFKKSTNIAGTPGTSGTNKDNDVTDIDSFKENGSRIGVRTVPGLEPTNSKDNIPLSPETKHRLWMSIGRALRKEPRKDGRKIGVTLSSLDPDVKLPSSQIVQHLTANGWTSSQVDPGGLVIWWAPENVLKAYGLEA